MPVGLDFETFCRADLKEVGLDNYVNHPSFRPLIASLAYDDGSRLVVRTFDFVFNDTDTKDFLDSLLLTSGPIAAHNAMFERMTLKHMGFPHHEKRWRDTAVIARALGAGERLEVAAPQLLGGDKMDDGRRLIRKFSMPQADGRVLVEDTEDWTEEDLEDWNLFKEYCELDARLSYQLYEQYGGNLPHAEWRYDELTQQLNMVGWPVDLALVDAMNEQFKRNLVYIEERFHAEFSDDEPLNFRSTPQLRKFCKDRGANIKSFDELNVKKALDQVEKKMTTVSTHSEEWAKLSDIHFLLRTKQELGGSSLSKLESILQRTGPDGRLRHQYVHGGAGQTMRTAARGVQLQNLKRFGGQAPADVEAVESWDNAELARNLRQVFQAEGPDDLLLVGDFASVESRGLGYIAGADWKTDAFRQGKDMYKVLASSMFGVPYEKVTKDQRQTGKVGELACGYGAGPQAVKDFAEKMGVIFTLDQAGTLVNDWRAANPEIVKMWRDIDAGLQQIMTSSQGIVWVELGSGFTLSFEKRETPASVKDVRSDAQTITMMLFSPHRTRAVLTRWFQGCFLDGRDICYMKPSELKSGAMWKDRWFKDGRSGRYKLYGGKLTGILIQSFCREIFFYALAELNYELSLFVNAKIIGQFHDEIVVEWTKPDHEQLEEPHYVTLARLLLTMKDAMSSSPSFAPDFPLAAEINSDRRYVK